MADKVSRMRPHRQGCSSHLMCLPQGQKGTKVQQHVPVCLISPYELHCTCRLLTRHGLFVLAQAALLAFSGMYFYAHVRTHTHFCLLMRLWNELSMTRGSVKCLAVSYSWETRHWGDSLQEYTGVSGYLTWMSSASRCIIGVKTCVGPESYWLVAIEDIGRVTKSIIHTEGTRGGRGFLLTVWLLSEKPRDILKADTVPNLSQDWFQSRSFLFAQTICLYLYLPAAHLLLMFYESVWFFCLKGSGNNSASVPRSSEKHRKHSIFNKTNWIKRNKKKKMKNKSSTKVNG